jgi:molybdate transport system substrate-binding protein
MFYKGVAMNQIRRLFLLLISILCLLCTACGSTVPSTAALPAAITLHVFAAASLTESFTTIAAHYHQAHPTLTVAFNFAGAQVLEQQIANGAPADVFASADLANMQKASDAGLVAASQIFARNKLVLILPGTNAARIMTLHDLARKGVKIDIEAANVPAGKYTLEILNKLSQSPDYGSAYKTSVLGNVVSQEDNVKAVVQKVQLGEVDAGFVYQTDVTPSVATKVTVLPIPDAFNVIAQYPIAVVKQTPHFSQAQAFTRYVFSPDGQAVLASYHFLGVSS